MDYKTKPIGIPRLHPPWWRVPCCPARAAWTAPPETGFCPHVSVVPRRRISWTAVSVRLLAVPDWAPVSVPLSPSCRLLSASVNLGGFWFLSPMWTSLEWPCPVDFESPSNVSSLSRSASLDSLKKMNKAP